MDKDVLLPGQVAEPAHVNEDNAGSEDCTLKRSSLELLRADRAARNAPMHARGGGADSRDDDDIRGAASERASSVSHARRSTALLNPKFQSSRERLTDVRRATIEVTTGMSFKDLKFKHSFQSIPDATTSRKFSIQAMQHDSGDALLAQVNSKRLSVDNSPSIKEEVHGKKEEARDLQQEDKKTTANAASAEGLSSSSDVENFEATADIEKKSDAIGKSTDENVTMQGSTLPIIQKEGEQGHNETSEKEGSACVAAKTFEISSEKQDGNTNGAFPTHQPRPPKMKSFKKHMSLKTRAAMKRSNSTMVGHSLVDKNAEAAEPRRNSSFVPRLIISRAGSQESEVGGKKAASNENSQGSSGSGRRPSLNYSSVRGGRKLSIKTKAAMRRGSSSSAASTTS